MGVAGNQCCLCAQRFPRKKRMESGRGGPAAQLRPADFGCGGAGRRGAGPSGLKAGGILCPTPPPSPGRGSPWTSGATAKGAASQLLAGATWEGEGGARGDRWGCGRRMAQPEEAFGGQGMAACGIPRASRLDLGGDPESSEWAGERRPAKGQCLSRGSVYMNGVQDLGPCL